MAERIVPMIHVPDVRAAVAWYQSIGFAIRQIAQEEGSDEITWASLTFGESEIMMNSGGEPSDAPRRDVDLYIHVSDVDALRGRLDGMAEMIEDLHATFYGMREFVIRDLNGFWITFGQPLRT